MNKLIKISKFAESPDEAPAISPRVLAKQLNIGNPAHLEKRIRKELEEQGEIIVKQTWKTLKLYIIVKHCSAMYRMLKLVSWNAAFVYQWSQQKSKVWFFYLLHNTE